mgnify:CR=1 FL=1
MNPRLFVGLILLFVLSEFVAAVVGAWRMWGFRKDSVAHLFGVLYTCTAIALIFSGLHHATRPTGIKFSNQSVMFWFIAGSIRTFGLWYSVLGIIRNK